MDRERVVIGKKTMSNTTAMQYVTIHTQLVLFTFALFELYVCRLLLLSVSLLTVLRTCFFDSRYVLQRRIGSSVHQGLAGSRHPRTYESSINEEK